MLRRFKGLPLEKQMFLSFSCASALLLFLTLCLTLSLDIRRQRQSLDAEITSVAGYIAGMEQVSAMLDSGYPDPEVTRQLDLIHQNFPEIDTIAVYNAGGLRFYHTSRRESGDTFVSGEETPALAGADPYITTGYGERGSQRRAFHTIRNARGEVSGFAAVAISSSDILRRVCSLSLVFLAILGAALLTALLLSQGIVRLLRDSLGGRQPHELLELYLRQDNVLNALGDALVATGPDGTVVFANREAERLFDLGEGELLGRSFPAVFPETSCIQTARTGEEVRNRPALVRGRQVLCSQVPLRGDGQVHRVLNIFLDRTETLRLSDELSGTREMLDTMRFFNHEFMNKLHIILGYLQTGQTREAMDFIMNSSLVSGQAIRETANCVRVSKLCALIIGKMTRAAELGILLSVSKDSVCREEDLLLPVEDCVTIVGNLLENAIEELSRGEAETREITLSLYCRPDCNIITCADTGGGVLPELLPRIWEKGVSSKGEGRGFGLPLVRRLTERNGGEIQLDTEPGEGTLFTVTFTRAGEEGAVCSRPSS